MREHVVVSGLLVIAAVCFGAGATMLIRDTDEPQKSAEVVLIASTVAPSPVANSAPQLPNIDDSDNQSASTARNGDHATPVTPVNDRLHKRGEIVHSAPF